MSGLFGSICHATGGSRGGWVGAHAGIITGVMLRAFGTGARLYAAHRLAHYFPG